MDFLWSNHKCNWKCKQCKDLHNNKFSHFASEKEPIKSQYGGKHTIYLIQWTRIKRAFYFKLVTYNRSWMHQKRVWETWDKWVRKGYGQWQKAEDNVWDGEKKPEVFKDDLLRKFSKCHRCCDAKYACNMFVLCFWSPPYEIDCFPFTPCRLEIDLERFWVFCLFLGFCWGFLFVCFSFTSLYPKAKSR